MNVNLSSRDLLDSYNQVLSGDPQCEWTIFTYGGGTMDLKVQADGSGGLEELKEEFMDGRIQYAFIRITDENSGLPKFVQINWCGDGVPESKKGLFNNHSNTVARFFKAAHMQVNARNEDDINPSLIKKRLAEAGGAAYSVHKESQSRSSGGGAGGGGHERIAPVGSSYQPIKVDMGALRSGAKKDVIEPVGSSYVPTKANLNPTPAPVQATRSIAPPQAARPTPPPQAQAPAKAVDDDDTWGEEPPAVGARPAFVASSPAAKPAYVAPQTSFYKPPPPKVEAPTAAPAPSKPAADDKIGPVGTAYTPVSLPAPKKLASRWGQPAASEEPASKPSYGGGASRFGGGGAASGAGGGEKKLTWSERQAQAKARDAEEEKGSLAATAAVVGTTIASGASKVASSLPSFPARSTPPAPKAPAPDSDDGFDEPDAPPPAPPLASRPPPPRASAAPSFPDEDDFDEPDAPPPPPPPAPVVRAPIVNAAPSFPDDDDFDDDEPPAIPPPPPSSAPVAAVAAVAAAPVESVKKAYESIKETLVGPSETKAEGGSGGKRAKVLFDYEATEDNELALREGEILVELEMVDEGWWSAKGEKGDVGLFPANYVELLEDEAEEEEAPPPPPPPAAPSPPPRAPTPEPEPEAAGEDQGTVATALYDYDAAESNELSFKEGDRIHSIEEASEDWWSGVAPSGETGLFPANYVEVQK